MLANSIVLSTIHSTYEVNWFQAANILYVDSPAGVGFSYSKTRADYITGDLQTASDTHAFLLKVSLFLVQRKMLKSGHINI